MVPILDQYGNPWREVQRVSQSNEVMRLRHQIRRMSASYDATADGAALVNYYANSDGLSPNAANSASVRKKLRQRSRYEIIENNPYLKGTVLMVANDFVGSGPKLRIVDSRIPKDVRRTIERDWRIWSQRTKYRQKLWQSRIAKISDGEGIRVSYTNWNLPTPVKLDSFVIEAEQMSSLGVFNTPDWENEVDGVKLDRYGNPTSYYILDQHPGAMFTSNKGRWVSPRFVRHWFRKDRPWHRGIPEMTPSLPLCALLRRYTLAVVKAAESAADHAIVLQSQMPPGASYENQSPEDWFQTFPIEQGMMTALPWGYTMSQIDAKQPIQTYDVFVQALLLEIGRPIMVPHNLFVGTSKDANMSSGVLDTHIYKEGQKHERLHCKEEVLDPDNELWWSQYILTIDYNSNPELAQIIEDNPSLRTMPPEHVYRWDKIGIDHTDPAKVMDALATAKEKRFISDRDIQETYFDQDVDDWREEIEEDLEWERTQGLANESTDSNARDEQTNDSTQDEV